MWFILAHEIAHVMLGLPQVQYVLERSGQTGQLGNEEELADRVGAAILVSDSWVYALRKVHCTLTGLEQVARIAYVPLAVLIGRVSSSQMNIGLLHWWRGEHSWHVIDRPGVPSCLRGYFELSEAGRRKFDNLGNKELIVSIDGRVNGRPVKIEGQAYRTGREVFQLLEPSCEIWQSAERYPDPVNTDLTNRISLGPARRRLLVRAYGRRGPTVFWKGRHGSP